ncbi:hypothetical protein V8E55_006890 [Tylopilus felleus]
MDSQSISLYYRKHVVCGLSILETDVGVKFHPNTTFCRFILSDPETYPDPDIFDPEGFLGVDPQPGPREACFGWGRRECTGVRMVDSVIFTCVVTALATLDLPRHVDIKPFKCKIVPRSREVEDLHA